MVIYAYPYQTYRARLTVKYSNTKLRKGSNVHVKTPLAPGIQLHLYSVSHKHVPKGRGRGRIDIGAVKLLLSQQLGLKGCRAAPR